MHIGEFPLEFCFQSGYFLCQFDVGEGVLAEGNKSAHDGDVDLDGLRTVQYAG